MERGSSCLSVTHGWVIEGPNGISGRASELLSTLIAQVGLWRSVARTHDTTPGSAIAASASAETTLGRLACPTERPLGRDCRTARMPTRASSDQGRSGGSALSGRHLPGSDWGPLSEARRRSSSASWALSRGPFLAPTLGGDSSRLVGTPPALRRTGLDSRGSTGMRYHGGLRCPNSQTAGRPFESGRAHHRTAESNEARRARTITVRFPERRLSFDGEAGFTPAEPV
jgi:hypothetical protein